MLPQYSNHFTKKLAKAFPAPAVTDKDKPKVQKPKITPPKKKK